LSRSIGLWAAVDVNMVSRESELFVRDRLEISVPLGELSATLGLGWHWGR
jgi:hypothetical protein